MGAVRSAEAHHVASAALGQTALRRQRAGDTTEITSFRHFQRVCTVVVGVPLKAFVCAQAALSTSPMSRRKGLHCLLALL